MMARLTTARLAVLMAAAALAACSGNMDELEQYIDQVKSKPGGAIEPLPTPRPEPRFVYEPGNRRSPFMPDSPAVSQATTANEDIGPDPNRVQEPLEAFPLDGFRMVGNLEVRGSMIGLVSNSADGYVYQVRLGDFMGQNYGEIVSITPSDIELMEWHPNGQGGYVQRPTRISLSD